MFTFKWSPWRASPLCKECEAIQFNDESPDLRVVQVDGERQELHTKDSETYWLDELDYERKDAYPALPLLTASAAKGCEFCKALVHLAKIILPPYVPKYVVEAADQYLIFKRFVYDVASQDIGLADIAAQRIQLGELRLEVEIEYLVKRSNSLTKGQEKSVEWLGYFQFEVLADPDNFTAKYLGIHRKPVRQPYLCEGSLRLFKSWIEHCCDPHYIGSRETFIPTRLLDLMTPQSGYIRLVNTSQDPHFGSDPRSAINPSYVTLSYCWGDSTQVAPPLKTETVSLRDHLRQIPLEKLPRLFQDAISLIRALGYRYRWVDSLCIIQDDISDWERESAMMKTIYSGALFTLVPLACQSTEESFLRRSCSLVRVPFTSKRCPDYKGEYFLQPGQAMNRHHAISDSINTSLWSSRGWTFQEQLASKAILYIGKMMAFYHCPCGLRAENTDLIERPDSIDGMNWVSKLKSTARNGKHLFFYYMGMDARVWFPLVENYSLRNLTRGSDKLPALSGLAHDFAKYKSGPKTYAAGLWKGSLPHGLLWRCDRRTAAERLITHRKSDNYRAPSWSWAVGDGPVIWESSVYDGFHGEEHIVRQLSTSTSLDRMGHVEDGFMVLTEKMRWITSLAGDSVDPRIMLSGNENEHEWTAHFLRRGMKQVLQHEGQQVKGVQGDLDWGPPKAVLQRIQQEGLWVFRVAHFGEQRTICGLLLSSSTMSNGHSPDGQVFERVGWFRFENYTGVAFFEGCVPQTVQII